MCSLGVVWCGVISWSQVQCGVVWELVWSGVGASVVWCWSLCGLVWELVWSGVVWLRSGQIGSGQF